MYPLAFVMPVKYQYLFCIFNVIVLAGMCGLVDNNGQYWFVWWVVSVSKPLPLPLSAIAKPLCKIVPRSSGDGSARYCLDDDIGNHKLSYEDDRATGDNKDSAKG